MSETLTGLIHEIAQECVSRAPVLILGSGASAAHGIPGMPGLKEHLLTTIPTLSSFPEAQTIWQQFISKLHTLDLEAALNEVRFPDSMMRCIAEITWRFLVPFDLTVFKELILRRNTLPLTRLYRHLFKSTHTEIHVVTPNYDRVAEYAADAGEIVHSTGFGYGHLRFRAQGKGPRIHYERKPARTVYVWKVHGSFDWFRDKDGVVVGLPIHGSYPAGFEPVIVTPGVEKYRLTHDEPFLSIKQGADAALQSARSYLCIGYGFNDTHVQTKLVERCRTEPVPLVLVTKEITPTASAFLRNSKCQRYLAIEEHQCGCRIFTAEYPDGKVIEGKSFWRLDDFLTMVI